MAIQLTAEGAKQSLTAHLAVKGEEILAKYGPNLGWNDLQLLLQDRAYVRYPCEVVFDASPLQPGEFAFPQQNGDSPEQGFTLYVHPLYMLELARVPYLVLYQLVAVNYGQFASSDDAEIFGASALGLSREEYYDSVCELADQLGVGDDGAAPQGGGCSSAGCGSAAL
jgi:hypothetical protein